MRVGIHQPMYFPWLGLFDRIYRCDKFVLLDNVPYSKNYFLNRNRIKTPNGWAWITVPVLTKGKFNQLIKDVKIDNSSKWREKHWKSIYYNYQKAPYFNTYAEILKSEVYDRVWENLSDLCVKTLNLVLDMLKIKIPILKASELGVSGKKEDLLLNICGKLGADEYLSGPDGRKYLNLKKWEENGIKVFFHDYKHSTYPQLYGEFIPNLSIIDLLFNCGEKSLKILTGSMSHEDY